MSAFEAGGPGGGGTGGVDMNDLFEQMFTGGGVGGMGGMGAGPGRKSRKTEDEVSEYKVSLEDIYKGKTAHFNAQKVVICSHCKGSGGREGAKPKTCDTCKGRCESPTFLLSSGIQKVNYLREWHG